MRKQDITIGAEVAYGRGQRDASWSSIPVRVIVTSVDTTTGTTRVGIKPYPGESQYVPDYTRPANIWRLWAEQEEINAARAKADERKRAERKRAERVERHAKAAIEELLGMVPDGTDEATLVRETRIPHDGHFATRRQFTLYQVLDIARAVAEQARKGE